MLVPSRVVSLVYSAASIQNVSVPPGVGEELIAAFERDTGVSVPPQMKAWLEFTNSPMIGPAGFYGLKDCSNVSSGVSASLLRDVRDAYRVFLYRREKGWIPVASDGCGNNYFLATRGEYGDGFPVFFNDVIHDGSSPSFIVASTLWSFIEFFLESYIYGCECVGGGGCDFVFDVDSVESQVAGWPFEKAYVLERDPDILNYSLPFPWSR